MSVSLKSRSLTTIAALATVVLALGLSACNTIEGAGQDIKSTGGAIERTADDNK